ncbi:MAG: hypothetical protein UT86_C0002G0098 [Candidatus Magasanikbacteria bacterium GW2011_GWC2_40_17]|uniref:Uncharacterized protein n=1 Tax=Candidatus Magasanikbacteria bacterium GW2011_GWA2_42_32 TaxID=1619039 RepID=A0A0G1A8L0_9BACT|nr:MAG: hypothetical protein UT86_C0002G0098 [Candidatus Magasanikbacteria bacterium GW2011_GWC2_40_17]KKS57259.1 MAG: hypothetical protein UV20_C0002G0048 [Candidatus Magasanikbacteria bacterium GW2011_GWA2_42_32]OGH86148.1 MAG: hypothetical protein A2294_02745 [Candidatus Magasanikbacteria bacterium RIFOXYB2_FULL_38_10]
MAETSLVDLRLVEQLRQDVILRNFDVVKSQDPGRMVIVDCADGSRKLELLLHHYNLAQTAGDVAMDECVFHDPSLNGGGLLLHPESPLIKPHLRQHLTLLDSIEGGVHFKNLDGNGARPLILIYAHTPCAAATAYRLNIVEQMQWIVRAKQYLKELHPNWRVLCMVHVLKSGQPSAKEKRGQYASYVFSSRAFLRWFSRFSL